MILGLLLPGCGSLGLEPTHHVSDPEEAAVSIDAVDPSYGPIGGGNVVTIEGRGFEGSVSVAFGNAEVPATRLSATSIAVTAPDAGMEVTVDLTVTSDLGSATRSDGYRFGDSPPDPQDDTGDSGEEVEGVAGLVEFSLLQIACPDCFGLTSDLEVSADAAFHQPVAGSWVDWMPPSGSCSTSSSPSAPASVYLDAGSYVHLQSGSHSIGLVKTSGTGGPQYAASGLTNDDYARTAFYSLDIDGGADVPTQLVDDALLTPQGFAELTPTETLYTDLRSAFAARIARTGQTFTWSPSGGTGSFVVLMDAYDGRTGNPLGESLCVGADSGSMAVPSSVLSGWPSGSLLAIYFFRYQIEHPRLASGATLDAVARVGVLGTGVLQ